MKGLDWVLGAVLLIAGVALLLDRFSASGGEEQLLLEELERRVARAEAKLDGSPADTIRQRLDRLEATMSRLEAAFPATATATTGADMDQAIERARAEVARIGERIDLEPELSGELVTLYAEHHLRVGSGSTDAAGDFPRLFEQLKLVLDGDALRTILAEFAPSDDG